MPIDITVRHITLNDSVQVQAREMAAKLVETYPAIEYVHIVFDGEANQYSVSMTAQGGQATNVEAGAKGSDAIGALRELFATADAKLRRAAQKRQEVRK